MFEALDKILTADSNRYLVRLLTAKVHTLLWLQLKGFHQSQRVDLYSDHLATFAVQNFCCFVLWY